MIAPPLTITGGKLVLPTGEPKTGAIRCENGRIVALGDVTPQDGDTVFHAKGALVAPGLVDLGVFAIDKPAFHFGGITRAALMPDQGVVLDKPSAARWRSHSASEVCRAATCRVPASSCCSIRSARRRRSSTG